MLVIVNVIFLVLPLVQCLGCLVVVVVDVCCVLPALATAFPIAIGCGAVGWILICILKLILLAVVVVLLSASLLLCLIVIIGVVVC